MAISISQVYHVSSTDVKFFVFNQILPNKIIVLDPHIICFIRPRARLVFTLSISTDEMGLDPSINMSVSIFDQEIS